MKNLRLDPAAGANDRQNVKRLKLIAVMAVFFATLLWAYVAIVAPVYGSAGFKLYWPGPLRIAWIFVLALIPATFLPLRLSRPSVLVVWWLYVTVYVPAVMIPCLSLTLTSAELLPLDIAMLASLGFLCHVTAFKVLSLRRMRIGPRLFWSALFLAWAGGLVFVCARFSFSTLLFNLASLFLGGSEYTIRSGFFLQLSQSGRLLGYITGQIGEAIDPFLIAYGMVHKRKWPLAAGIVGQVAIFTVVGAKSIFFSTFFLVIVLWMARRYARNFGIALGSLLIAIVLLSAGVDSYSKTANLSSITTRRTLMDPGLLTGFYYEHYSQAPYAGWSYHFPKPGESILAPPYEIGLVYMGDANIEANANLWAQGFGDFGMSGIAGFTLLLAAMLWIYDSIAARQNREFAIVLVAMQAFAYSNSPPMTVFLTHGGLATALLLWTAPFIRPARVESEAASMR